MIGRDVCETERPENSTKCKCGVASRTRQRPWGWARTRQGAASLNCSGPILLRYLDPFCSGIDMPVRSASPEPEMFPSVHPPARPAPARETTCHRNSLQRPLTDLAPLQGKFRTACSPPLLLSKARRNCQGKSDQRIRLLR